MEPEALQRQINQIKKDVQVIRTNHLQHLALNITELRNDVKWIKKIGYFVVAQTLTFIGALALVVFQHWIK